MKLEDDHAELGKWLVRATSDKLLPLSSASSFYMRECRRRLLGAVHEHFHDQNFSDSDISTCHIIHPKWLIPEGRLKDLPAAQVKQNFTRYLERTGVSKAEGLLFAGLHGSFDGTGFQLHYHGIVAGDKLDALRGMNNKFGFASSKDKIYRPIIFGKLKNPPRQISYCLQNWWPYEPQPPDPLFYGKRRRLPTDAHAEFLLWMAQQNLMDLIVMNGMRVGKDGLESTRPNTE